MTIITVTIIRVTIITVTVIREHGHNTRTITFCTTNVYSIGASNGDASQEEKYTLAYMDCMHEK